ncbi:uncharacterized protein CbrC (UPF0167 family) [Paenibacillus sp. RC254]
MHIRWIFNKNGCGSQSYEAICPWCIAEAVRLRNGMEASMMLRVAHI